MYLSYQKKINYCAIGYSHREHNHHMNPDLFSYFVHQTRHIRHDKALELAKGLWGEASYNKATRILKNYDLKIERKQAHNLTRAEATRKLKPDYELTHLLATMDHKDFRVYVNNVYQTNEVGMIVFLKATS